MKRTFKAILSLTLAALSIFAMLAFVGCEVDVENDVESMLDDIMLAESYTIDIAYDDGTIYKCKVSDGKFYSLSEVDGVESKKYIYKSDDGKYYSVSLTMIDGKQTSFEKKELTVTEYSTEYTSAVNSNGVMSKIFAYRHVLDMAEETDDGFKYSTINNVDGVGSTREIYTIEIDDEDLVYTYEFQGKSETIIDTIRVSAIDDTEFDIPETILSR